jgi:6-phosphofructokinase 1
MLAEQVKAKLGISRVRADTFGYLQRSFIGAASDVDAREAREVGETAVQFAMFGDVDGSVVIERVGDYAVRYRLAPLADIAGKTRVMPDDFIAAGGNDVTGAFRDYMRPLLGAGVPDAFRLMADKVTKILK